MSSIIMQKSDILLDIINRIKEIKHLHSDAKVAEVLEMSRNDLYGFKKRGSLPLKHLHAFCEREGIMLEYIINGTPPVHGADPGPMPKIPGHGFGTLIKETTAPYGSDDTSSSRPKISDLLSKTAAVLESKSIFSNALTSNIEAFHEAINLQTKLADHESMMKEQEARLKTVEDRLYSMEQKDKAG